MAPPGPLDWYVDFTIEDVIAMALVLCGLGGVLTAVVLAVVINLGGLNG